MVSDKNHQLINHLPQIRHIVGRIAKNHAQIDDITQECCVKIIEKEHLWRDQSKYSQWINAVTRNLTLNWLTKEKRQKGVPLTDSQMEAFDDTHFSEKHIAWVIEQFPSLSPMQKKVLQMRYFDEMKVIDIASQLNISQQAVTIHQKRALDKLKKRAQAQGLLSALLPYHWDTNKIAKGLLMAFKTKASIALLTCAATLTAVNIFSQNSLDKANIDQHSAINENQLALEKDALNKKITQLENKNASLHHELKQAKNQISLLNKELNQTNDSMAGTTPKDTQTQKNDITRDGEALIKVLKRISQEQLLSLNNDMKNGDVPQSTLYSINHWYDSLLNESNFSDEKKKKVTDLLITQYQRQNINRQESFLMLLDPNIDAQEIIDKQGHYRTDMIDHLSQELTIEQIEQVEKINLDNAKQYTAPGQYRQIINRHGFDDKTKKRVLTIIEDDEKNNPSTFGLLMNLNFGIETITAEQINNRRRNLHSMTLNKFTKDLNNQFERTFKRFETFINQEKLKEMRKDFDHIKMMQEMQFKMMLARYSSED